MKVASRRHSPLKDTVLDLLFQIVFCKMGASEWEYSEHYLRFPGNEALGIMPPCQYRFRRYSRGQHVDGMHDEHLILYQVVQSLQVIVLNTPPSIAIQVPVM
jgi:hypothetical protein